MKVAVTGASGFVGQHVIKRLLKNDVEVIAITRNVAHLSDLSNIIRIVEMDIACPTSDCYEEMGRPDILIHLAWNGLPNYKSLHHFDTELPRQYHFLKLMIEAGLPTLLVTGTCFEYGMQSGLLNEDMDTLPSNPYGFAKDALRSQLQYLQQTIPFDLTWARLFYLYGEGQAENSLLSQLKSAVESGDSVFNMSGGEQLRDFLPITQVANYLVNLVMTARNNNIVNICSGQPISVRKLVEDFIHKNGWNIALNLGYYPYPDYEPMAFWGDNKKLEQCLVPK